MPRGEHKVGCNQSSRTCASPQPSTLAAKANDAACRYLVSADDPATDYSERWLVAAEGKGTPLKIIVLGWKCQSNQIPRFFRWLFTWAGCWTCLLYSLKCFYVEPVPREG